jgi:hypothetical protein
VASRPEPIVAIALEAPAGGLAVALPPLPQPAATAAAPQMSAVPARRRMVVCIGLGLRLVVNRPPPSRAPLARTLQ